jgi:peptide/nickel transport system permease protein
MMGQLRNITRKLSSDKRSRWAVRLFGLLVFFAVFGDFVANEKPLYCKFEGKHYFPVLRSVCVNAQVCKWNPVFSSGDWHEYNYESVVFPLIPYSATTLDPANGNYRAPFSEQNVRSVWFRHWLGTDALGRDVAAGLIYGCRIALIVGLLSMLIAVMIGVPIGVRAGYFGNDRAKRAWPALVLDAIGSLVLIWFLVQAGLMYFKYSAPSIGTGYLITACFIGLITWIASRYINKFSTQKMMVGVPWDFAVMRSIEVLRSIPAFFLLFAVLGIVESPSIYYVVLLIGMLRVPTIIRYIRAEAMKLRDKTFIDAARVIGLSDNQIISKHVIPNSMGPVLITVAFGIGGAVLLESGLSFLGIGLSIDQMSWGKLLSSARDNFSAWWLAILPGGAIFLTVAIFNIIGEVIADYLEAD